VLFSTVQDLVSRIISADQEQSQEELDKSAQAAEDIQSGEIIAELDQQLEAAGYGPLQKQASQLGMAKLLVGLDILSKVTH
jgi:hypothetical protein